MRMSDRGLFYLSIVVIGTIIGVPLAFLLFSIYDSFVIAAVFAIGMILLIAWLCIAGGRLL
jgi:hypothetical protein